MHRITLELDFAIRLRGRHLEVGAGGVPRTQPRALYTRMALALESSRSRSAQSDSGHDGQPLQHDVSCAEDRERRRAKRNTVIARYSAVAAICGVHGSKASDAMAQGKAGARELIE